MSRYLDTSTKPQMAQIMVQHGRPSRSSWRKIRKILLEHGWEQVPNWECLFVHREKRLFLSVHVDEMKQAGKKQNIDPMWKVFMKSSRFGRTDIIPWPCLCGLHSTRMFKQAKILWTIIEICLNPKSLLELRKTCLILRNLANTFPHGPMMWKVMQRNAWNDIANWRTKQLNNYTKSQLHALTTTKSRIKKWDLLENCQRFAHKLFLNAHIWRALVGLIFEWSVNKLARAITKWTSACDQRLGPLVSYVHHTCEFKQYCHVGNKARQRRLGLFQSGLWFCRRLRRLKINIRRTLVHIRKSYVRAKKLDVQETDISLTRFNRSWNYFSWCRITHGWNTSSWSLGFGYWSVSFYTKPIKETKDQVLGRLVAWDHITQAHPKPNQDSNSSRQSWIESCWLCFIERKVFSIRCDPLHFLKTTKQWLKWSSKAEVQQWDTYPEPTELLKTGCLTELIWIRRFKSNMLTPKNNSLTCWLKGTSHVMSGTIFTVCSTSAIWA